MYARHMGVPKMIKKKLAFGLIPSRNVINPKIRLLLINALKTEKNAQKDADELEQKRQEEIIERNLRKDRIEQMNRKNRERSGAFHENETEKEKQAASNRFIQMRKNAQERGPSTLRKQSRGGKRKTRKHRKKKTKKLNRGADSGAVNATIQKNVKHGNANAKAKEKHEIRKVVHTENFQKVH